jgi:regulator of protease activity HflC (stomatin/prohibitin superfamily)
VGWYFTTAEMELAGTDPYAGPTLNPAIDGYLITADQNIVHARATMTYRIENAVQYIFGFEGDTNRPFNGAGASNLVVNALNSALVKAASEFKVDSILYSDVLGFRDAVRRKVVAQLNAQTNGVEVEQIDVTTKAPLFLKADFARVNDAAIRSGKLVNEAQTKANEIISAAEARAATMTNFASVESESLINKLKGEEARFKDLLPAYRQNPDLFVQRQLTERLAIVMTNVQEKIFVSDMVDERRWMLNREPQKINREQPKQ